MTEQECEVIFQKLVEMLKQHQLSELINRTADQIAEGKIVENDIKTFQENFDTPQSALPMLGLAHSNIKPASKASFSTVVPLVCKERLEILIDVIEQALITPIEIENYLRQTFLERHAIQRLAFVTPKGEEVVRIDKQYQNDQLHRTSIDQLRAALALLRKEL